MSGAYQTPIPPALLGTIQSDVTYDAYSQYDGINAHGLMDVLKSPGTFRTNLDQPRSPPSPSMLLGILFETALLEPKRFAAETVVGTARSAGEGQTAITQAAYDKIQAMLASVGRNRHAREALANVEVQPVALWQDGTHDVPCKARLDALAKFSSSHRVAIDIKTARAAGAADFSRAAAQFQYDLQAAHYLAAGKATGAFDADIFLFVVVQNAAPFHCFVYEAGAQMLARGRAWREHAMRLYRDCRQANDWPGEPEFQTLDLPRWAAWPEQASSEAANQVSDDGLSDPPDLE